MHIKLVCSSLARLSFGFVCSVFGCFAHCLRHASVMSLSLPGHLFTIFDLMLQNVCSKNSIIYFGTLQFVGTALISFSSFSDPFDGCFLLGNRNEVLQSQGPRVVPEAPPLQKLFFRCHSFLQLPLLLL